MSGTEDADDVTAGSYVTGRSEGLSPTAFRQYCSAILMIAGALLLASYVLSIVQAFESWISAPGEYLGTQRALSQFLSTVVGNPSFYQAIIGLSVLLIGLHIRNTRLSNKVIAAVVTFCFVNVTFIIVLLVLMARSSGSTNSGEFFSLRIIIGDVALALIQAVAFTALALVELPRARAAIIRKFKPEKVVYYDDEDDDETDYDDDMD